jgi:branched-chain amino acid transport system substrate-binding protein
VGKTDSLEIQKMLKSGMKDFKLAQGPQGTTAAFDEKGSVNFPMFIAVVKNGKRILS